MEKSSLEILKDFADKSDRRIETTSDLLRPTGFMSFQQTKRTAVIPYDSKDDLHFYWYNNPVSFSPMSMYCGVFFEANIAEGTEISIQKKSFADSLTIFKSDKPYKTGDFSFDKTIIIKGHGFESMQMIMNKQNFQHNVLEIVDTDQRFKIEINKFSPDFGPLQNKNKIVCLYIKDFWILENKLIEKTFILASKLKGFF